MIKTVLDLSTAMHTCIKMEKTNEYRKCILQNKNALSHDNTKRWISPLESSSKLPSAPVFEAILSVAAISSNVFENNAREFTRKFHINTNCLSIQRHLKINLLCELQNSQIGFLTEVLCTKQEPTLANPPMTRNSLRMQSQAEHLVLLPLALIWPQIVLSWTKI